VKRFFIYLPLAILFLLLICGAAYSWIVYSSSGTRWLLKRVPEWVGIDLSIDRVDGCLGTTLNLENIELIYAGNRLQLDRLTFDARMTSLLSPKIEIDQLQLFHLRVDLTEETTAETDSSFEWPVLPPLLKKIELELVNFELVDAQLQHPSQRTKIDLLQLHGRWKKGSLCLDQLILKTAAGEGTGTAQLGIYEPALQLDITFETAWGANILQQLRVQADLQLEAKSGWFGGPVTIDAKGEKTGNLSAQMDLNLSVNKITLQHFNVHSSLLQDHPLTGEASIVIDTNGINIDHFYLGGREVTVEARGNLTDKLEFSYRIEQLQQLLADARGTASGDGWLHWQDGKFSGVVTATGNHLEYQQWHLDQFTLRGKTPVDAGRWQLQLDGNDLIYAQQRLADQFNLIFQGSIMDHRLSLTAVQQHDNVTLHLVGGWSKQQWRGVIDQFQIHDDRIGPWKLNHESKLRASQRSIEVDSLKLDGDGDQTIHVQGLYMPLQQRGRVNLDWRNLDLTPLNHWMPDGQISGRSDGNCRMSRGKTDHIDAQITFIGQLRQQQLSLGSMEGKLLFNWNNDPLKGDITLDFNHGGSVRGEVTAGSGAVFTRPSQLNLNLRGDHFPLHLAQPWLPSEVNIDGEISWELTGKQQPSGMMTLRATAETGPVKLSWEGKDTLLDTDITTSKLDLQWDRNLHGQMQISLGNEGMINADLHLPLGAKLPLKIEPQLPIIANLKARLGELDILSLFFPGKIQESQGQLQLDLHLSGSLENPHYRGEFELANGGAFVPPIGVKLNDLEIKGSFDDALLAVTTLNLISSRGDLHGEGELQHVNWSPGRYSLRLQGKQFQIVNLPELQIEVSPDLTITGQGRQLKVRGRVGLPHVVISGEENNTVAAQSPDLVIVDAPETLVSQSLLIHDIDIQLDLGEQVTVNSAGLDAKLEGEVRLYTAPDQTFGGDGKIDIVKGKFSSYGVSLDIERGAIYFTGAVKQPILDILAIRRAGEVKAGVTVSGTPQLPQVALYSEPFMPDADILSYIVLGRPIGGKGGSDTNLLMGAAGALLSQGESATLQEKVKSSLGLDTLDFSSGDGNIRDSVVTTGKYLNPDLYISLGHSLFQSSNELNIRYDMTPSWQVESSVGSTKSGVDLFYKIEIK